MVLVGHVKLVPGSVKRRARERPRPCPTLQTSVSDATARTYPRRLLRVLVILRELVLLRRAGSGEPPPWTGPPSSPSSQVRLPRLIGRARRRLGRGRSGGGMKGEQRQSQWVEAERTRRTVPRERELAPGSPCT